MVEVRDLRYAYGERQVLNGVSFSLAPGERAALLGPNGAGKSTLLLHLNGILRGAGQVRVDGVSAEDPKVREKVGLVFQDAEDQLFCPTVEEDVAFGPLYQGLTPDEVRKRVAQALEAVGLQGVETRSPHQLSGGEKKRVAVATVLSMNCPLLVLDEPTVGLDARARRSLIDLLAGFSDRTILVATHDLPMVEDLLERSLVLQKGELVYDGPTAELIRDQERLQSFGLVA